jgi:hypothetical protein
MIESFTIFYEEHQVFLGLMAGISLAMFVGSLLSLPWLLSLIPVDYFKDPEPYKDHHEFGHPIMRLMIVGLKNLLGGILILAGVAMLVLPGQGILTIVMGMLLINFPGKRAFERRLVSNPKVLRSINWFRKKRGREPLLAPGQGTSIN